MSSELRSGQRNEPNESGSAGTGRVVLAWTLVGVPLAYGVTMTLVKASQLFTG